jgi:hypothetical protein
VEEFTSAQKGILSGPKRVENDGFSKNVSAAVSSKKFG